MSWGPDGDGIHPVTAEKASEWNTLKCFLLVKNHSAYKIQMNRQKAHSYTLIKIGSMWADVAGLVCV